MGNFDFKDKKNIYLIVVCLLIVGLIYYTYDYVYNPYELRKNQLESELSTAQYLNCNSCRPRRISKS